MKEVKYALRSVTLASLQNGVSGSGSSGVVQTGDRWIRFVVLMEHYLRKEGNNCYTCSGH